MSDSYQMFPEEVDSGPHSDGRPFGPEVPWWREGRQVIGTDEAGRGPVAGPVVAGAVAFDPGVRIIGIDDSKRLSPSLRAELFDEIREKALAWAVAETDAARIDRIYIIEATLEAMTKAVSRVAEAIGADYPGVFVDGRMPQLGIGRQVNIIRGDSTSFSIGAASILAKVHRDRIMIEMDKRYPGYGFARNKGYGTQKHIEAIKRLGYSPIHRRSFHICALETAILTVKIP